MESIYKTIVVKLSGEALADEGDKTIYDRKLLKDIAHTIHDIVNLGTRVGVVVGAGNIWRGRLAEKVGIERSTGDYMGMLGTIINALALQSAFEEEGMCTRVMSAIDVPQVCEPYIRRKAMSHLEKGRVVIFAAGIGSPYFTTDTCTALRAKEMMADSIFMGKNGVDGVFTADPRKDASAKLIDKITYHEILAKGLQVMDSTAVGLLEDTDIDIRVFNMADPENAVRLIRGEKIGTLISRK